MESENNDEMTPPTTPPSAEQALPTPPPEKPVALDPALVPSNADKLTPTESTPAEPKPAPVELKLAPEDPAPAVSTPVSTPESIQAQAPQAPLDPVLANATPEKAAPVAPKKKTLSITIRDKSVLYAAYMPFLNNGGLFIPTKKPFAMGEPCALVIALLNEDDRYSVEGKVVWITPSGSPTNKAGGIGIEFAETNEGDLLRRKIEDILGPLLKSDNATHTM